MTLPINEVLRLVNGLMVTVIFNDQLKYLILSKKVLIGDAGSTIYK